MNLIGYGIATLGPALAIGWIFATLISSIARQPEAKSAMQPMAILGFAAAEALAIFGLVLAFIK